MTENETLTGEYPPPDTESWMEYSWRLRQNTPDRLEDAAKFLAVVTGISLTIYTATLKSISMHPMLQGLVLICWACALAFAFFTLFPKKYPFVSISSESIKKAHDKIVRTKQRLLVIASLLYFIPFVLIIVLHAAEIWRSYGKEGL